MPALNQDWMIPTQIPEMRTWIDEEVVTPQQLNEQIRDATNFALNPPLCKMKLSAPQSFTSGGSSGKVLLNVATEDTDQIFDSVNNEALIVTPGLYLVLASIQWSPNTVGVRGVRIFFNGTALPDGISQQNACSAYDTYQQANSLIRCAAGDKLALYGFQTSGGALNAQPGSSTLAVRWVGA